MVRLYNAGDDVSAVIYDDRLFATSDSEFIHLMTVIKPDTTTLAHIDDVRTLLKDVLFPPKTAYSSVSRIVGQ